MIASLVIDANDIALQIDVVKIGRPVVDKAIDRIRLIIQEKQRVLPFFQTEQLAVDVVIVRRFPVCRLADTVAVSVVGIGIGIRTVGYGRQLAPCRPSERLTVVIGQRLSEVMVDTMTSACLPRH